MALLFNWPRRTPYLNQLDRARRDSRLACRTGERGPCSRTTYAPTIMRSFAAPAAIVAPNALGLCANKAIPGGLCPVCRSGIVNQSRGYGLLCCKGQHTACPSCGVIFDDIDDETHKDNSSTTNSNQSSHKVKGQQSKGGQGSHTKHQQDLLLKPHNVEVKCTKLKLSKTTPEK